LKTGTPSLFKPTKIAAIDVANRIVMAPMTRNRAGAGDVPQALNAEYYAQRAGAGLIITEGSQISAEGKGYPDTPGIHSAEQVAGWRLVTEAVHRRGGRIFMQLWHVGRISHPSLQPNGQLPVAPSALKPAGNAMIVRRAPFSRSEAKCRDCADRVSCPARTLPSTTGSPRATRTV